MSRGFMIVVIGVGDRTSDLGKSLRLESEV
jgi:hypothetical protein